MRIPCLSILLTYTDRHDRCTDVNVGVTNAIPPIAAAHTHAQANANAEGSGLPMRYTRNPPKTPILRPNYRYCYKDGFIKPPRAHHCRACGTVRSNDYAYFNLNLTQLDIVCTPIRSSLPLYEPICFPIDVTLM